MGLLSIIRKVKRKEREMRVLIVCAPPRRPPLHRRLPPAAARAHAARPATDRSGLDNAGKTTAVKQLCGEDATLVAPTLGFAIRTLHLGGCACYNFVPAPAAPRSRA